MAELLIPGAGILTDPAGGKDLLVPGAGIVNETAAAATAGTVPLVGRGPGMALAGGGGLAGNAGAAG